MKMCIARCAEAVWVFLRDRVWGLADWSRRRMALKSMRSRQQIREAGWLPWTKADALGLARYVTAEAKLWAELGVSRYELLRMRSPETRTRLVGTIYDRLREIGIRYSENQYSPELYQQRIRSPIETVGVDAREGTCLDLAILFAGVCIGCDLLPIVVLLDGDDAGKTSGHAFVLVSISHDLDQWRKRAERRTLEIPITDPSTLHGLLDGRICQKRQDLGSGGAYLAVECTGFARANLIGGQGPEARQTKPGRDFLTLQTKPGRDFLTFEEATDIGRRQLGEEQLRRRPLRAAVDVACAHFLHGITPYRLPPRPRTWWKPYAAWTALLAFVILVLFFVWSWKATSDQADILASEILSAQMPLKAIPERLHSAGQPVREALRPRLSARVADYLAKREVIPAVTAPGAKPDLDPQSHVTAARSALALYHLGEPSGILQMLDTKDKPYHPEGRSLTLWYMAAARVPVADIHLWLKRDNSPSARQALILSLGEYDEATLKAEGGLEETILALFETDDDPGVHAAAQWLLDSAGNLPEASFKFAAAWARAREQGAMRLANRSPDRRQWFVHSASGITFVYLPGGIQYLMGHADTQERSPQGATDIGAPTRHGVRIGWPLLVGMTEVTALQYKSVLPPLQAPGPSHPEQAVKLPWAKATEFCNSMATGEGRAVGYELALAASGVTTIAKQKPAYLGSGTYRLPTEAEWEYACRAGSLARYSFGDQPFLLERYAFYLTPDLRPLKVAARRPNDFGLFDCHGGVWEWCDDSPTRYASVLPGEYLLDVGNPRPEAAQRIARGGAFNSRDWLICASYTRGNFGFTSDEPGIRIVRSCGVFPN